MQNQSRQCFIYGLGYSAGYLARHLVAQGWSVAGTTRDAQTAVWWAEQGVHAVHPASEACMNRLVQATHLLISVPPGEGHAMALAACRAQPLPQLQWIGYLSSTGVYGDHDGAWVDEDTLPKPQDERTRARLQAERDWQAFGEACGRPVQCFRLAGIYGPGRNIVEQLRAGTARRIIKPGHVFSRIHVEDIATALRLGMLAARNGTYNLCDDLSAPSHEVVEYGCELLRIPHPAAEAYDVAVLSPMMRSFYSANRRVRNDRVKAQLGMEFAYSTYREGLKALAAALHA